MRRRNFMNIIKSALLTGVGITTLSLGTTGIASAHSGATQQSQDTLSARIAVKFNLSQTDVQNIIDQYRSDHKAEFGAKRAEKLQRAVADGKITQVQADYITNAWKEIDTLVDQAKSSDSENNSEVWKQVKQKVEDLRTWAKDQGISSRYVSSGLWGQYHSHGWNRHDNHNKSH